MAGGPGGAFAGRFAALKTTCQLFAHDNEHFLGRGLCSERREGVGLGEAWAAVTSYQLGATERRSYFRMPLGKELCADLCLRRAAEVCGAHGDNCDSYATGGMPPVPFAAATSAVWVSCSGCRTPLHYDLCHGLLTQVEGSKRVLLAAPTDTRSLYPRGQHSGLNGNTSRVDLARWVADEASQRRDFPNVCNADIYEVLLGPGDTLYTPPFWWHHVETLGGAASVSVLLAFDPTPAESTHPCVGDGWD